VKSASVAKSGSTKTTPTPLNAPYRRITEDDWKYVEKPYADNSYQSKGGDDWGGRANEVLSQVHGKGFRHEKTKKKRGSYRGGEIDMSVNSIKFKYDD